jgi:hypothetical protein
MTAPTTRKFPNKWPGKCRHCGDKVPAYAGIRVNEDGTWHTEHDGACAGPVPPSPPPVGEVIGVLSTWTVGDVTMILSGDPGYTPRHSREAA